MAAFRKRKVKIETLGEYLRETRESLNLSAAQVRQLTQISERFLAALESSDYAKLPADVYVKGFLKKLAAVYRISPQALIDQYEKERGVERRLKKEFSPPDRSQSWLFPKTIITPKTITVAAVVMLALVGVGYLVWQVRSVSSPPALEVFFPAENTIVSNRSILLRGQSELGSRVYVNDGEILVDENGAFSEILNLREGVNRIIVRAENKFGRSSEVERFVMVEPPSEETATTTADFLDRQLVVIVTVGPAASWIKAEVDDEVVQDGVVEPGDKLIFDADKKIVLSTGNAGSTRVVYNGKDLGILGREGEVIKNILFTSD